MTSLENYKKAFDIVIGFDGNFLHIAQILEAITGETVTDFKSYGENASLIEKIIN